MFSKGDSRKLREEFWISFGKSFPRKWILYRTKIKGLSFKFHFDLKKAVVSVEIDTDLEQRIGLWTKFESLKNILVKEYAPNAVYQEIYHLNNTKDISRIYVQLNDVSIHNKNTWRNTMEFLNTNMLRFEKFFLEYEDVLNTTSS